MRLFGVLFLQTVAFLLVHVEEGKGKENGDCAEAGEDGHRGLVGGIDTVHLTDPHGHEGEADVLNVEDDGEGRSEQLHGNDLGHAGPHGRGHKGKGHTENEHENDGKPAVGEDVEHEGEVHGGEHHRADEHEGGTFTHLVIDNAEKGRKDDRAEGEQTGNQAGIFFGYAIVGDHQLGGELQEGEYATIEEETEEGDEPETGIGEDSSEIGELEALVFGFFRGGLAGYGCDRGVQTAIHHVVDQETEETGDEEGGSDEDGELKAEISGFGQRKVQTQCGSSTQTCEGYLHPHGQSQLVAGEPLGDGLRNGDTRDFTAHSEDGEAQASDSSRHGKVERADAEDGAVEVGGDGHVFDEYTDHHQRGAEHAGEADAEFVEDDTAEEEHQEENIDEAVAAGEETVVVGRPTEAALCDGGGENALKRREKIGDIVAHHHGEGHNEEGCPTSRCGIVELLCDGLCYVHCRERGEMIDDKEIMFYLRYLSSQRKKVRCQRIPFCGRSTQWFSSGKRRSWAGMPRRRAAVKALSAWVYSIRKSRWP